MKSLEQISLFASEEATTKRYLHVVQDGEVKDLTLDELFDATKFTRIRAVSFVAGIEDGQVAGSFSSGL